MCDVHAAGPARFHDATASWGLDAQGASVTGNRIVAADVDGDGYPDLVVQAVSSNARTQLPGGPWLVRLLMNRPRPGGGRRFVDATVASGFFQTRSGSTTELRSAHVAVFADVDGDGDLDAFSGTYVDPTHPATDPGDRSEVLLNDGRGVFTLAPASATSPSSKQLWPTTSATFADVDRDGIVDVYVGFWYASYGRTQNGVQAQLYRGRGDGTFEATTVAAGLTTDAYGFDDGTNTRPAYGVTSCDVDGDGAPDLMVSAYGRQWNELWHNRGDGTFAEVGREAGYAGDDDLDYSDNQFFACYCTLHAEAPDCAGVGAPRTTCPDPADAYWAPGTDDQPWRLNGNTFTTWCGDADGDGRLDLYSAAIRHWHIGGSSDASGLVLNDGSPEAPHFARLGNDATGLAWPHPTPDWNEGGLMVAGADLDGDARTDFFVAASDYPDQFGLLFHQKSDGTYEEVGEAWGLHHACASGLAVADFDRDGDLDVVVGSGTARDCSKTWKTNEVHLYESDASEHARSLALRLVADGVHANRAAIGARVTVEAGGVARVQELGGGYGHMGMQHDTVLSFGVGACASARVTVRWPDAAGTTESWDVVEAGGLVELRQGDREAHRVALDAP